MASTAKKSSKSVNFTTDDADQELLKEVESVIADGQYASFSDLCKDALEQFLFPDATPATGDTPDLSRLEQQLVQVQTQLASLATLQSEHEVNQLSQLEDQLLHLAQQIEQLDESTRQIPEQIQQQYESLESLVSGQVEGTDSAQLETQLSRLSQQLKQVDTKTSQMLGQVQSQLSALEDGFPGQPSAADAPVNDQLEAQLVELADQIEKLSVKMTRAIKELQQQITDLADLRNGEVSEAAAVTSEGFAAEELATQLENHVTNLTERINWVDAKSEERLVQLQRQLTELAQNLAAHEAQYMAKVEGYFTELVEKMATPKVAAEPIIAASDPDEAPASSARSLPEDPLLSRLSSLIEDF